MFKRISLMMIVNFGIMITLGIVLSLTGINRYFSAQGLDYTKLLIFCSIYGFAGSLISLFLSKKMVKWKMKIKTFDSSTASNQTEKWLYQSVKTMAKKAGLPKTPEVGIYESPEMNAFATGPSKSNSLVCVSTGLLEQMTQDEVEGVLAHEVAHVSNGDMVTMMLLQGIMNTLVMFVSRIIAHAITSRGERRSHMMYYMVSMALDMALGFLGMIVIAYFSRKREFRADQGGAQFSSKTKMVSALEKLQQRFQPCGVKSEDKIATLKINTSPSRFKALLSTHPPLEDRIKALKRPRVR